jgi:hypothetical protein
MCSYESLVGDEELGSQPHSFTDLREKLGWLVTRFHDPIASDDEIAQKSQVAEYLPGPSLARSASIAP